MKKVLLVLTSLSFCSDLAVGGTTVQIPAVAEPGANSSITSLTGLTTPLPVREGGTGVTSFTAGSVPFSSGTILTQDNANFFWDATNHRLGIGTTTPHKDLDVNGIVHAQGDGNMNISFGSNYNGDGIKFSGGNESLDVLSNSLGGVAYISLVNPNNSHTVIQSDANTNLVINTNGSSNATGVRIEPSSTSQTAPILDVENNAENTHYFTVAMSGSVGIGTTSPAEVLEVNGGVRLNTATSRPSCTSSIRGDMWVTGSGAGVTDNLSVCLKSAADTYSWVSVVTGG